MTRSQQETESLKRILDFATNFKLATAHTTTLASIVDESSRHATRITLAHEKKEQSNAWDLERYVKGLGRLC